MKSVGESSSFYTTCERSTHTQTLFGKEGPILAANFGPPGPIFAPDQIFRDSSLVHHITLYVCDAGGCGFAKSN